MSTQVALATRAPQEAPQSNLIRVRLKAIRHAARDTHLYEFVLPEGGTLPHIEPGAHIGLHLPNGMIRQYSLVHCEPSPRSYVVGVKRDAQSRGGSRYIHEALRVGALLEIDAPRNNFPLDTRAARSLFIAGGIGITPIWCMVQCMVQLGLEYTLHYACRTREEAAFLAPLQALNGTREKVHLHFDDEAGGRFLDLAPILANAGAGTHLYCCGPGPMLAAFEAATAGRPREEVHVEYFTAKEEAALGGGYVVQLAKSAREFRIPPGKSILQVVREAGVFVSSSCEEGICGACETGVIFGEPDHRDAILSDEEKKQNRTMMVCCSGSKSAKLVLDL